MQLLSLSRRKTELLARIEGWCGYRAEFLVNLINCDSRQPETFFRATAEEKGGGAGAGQRPETDPKADVNRLQPEQSPNDFAENRPENTPEKVQRKQSERSPDSI